MGEVKGETKRNWRVVEKANDDSIWDKEAPVEGVLKLKETGVGPNKSMMYTLRTEDGEIKVWGSTVLDDKLENVPVGSYVMLEYEGKLVGKKGSSYHSFKVMVDDATPIDANDITEEDLPPEFNS